MPQLKTESFNGIKRLLNANSYEFVVKPDSFEATSVDLSLVAEVRNRSADPTLPSENIVISISKENLSVSCSFPVRVNFGDAQESPEDFIDTSGLRGEPLGVGDTALSRHMREKFPGRSDLIQISMHSLKAVLTEVDKDGHPYLFNAFSIETLGVDNKYLVADFSDKVLIELADGGSDSCVARIYLKI